MNPKINKLKNQLYTIIFGTDTPAGKAFDILLLIAIICNTFIVVTDSVDSIIYYIGSLTIFLNVFFVVLFTIEYFIRIWIVEKREAYIFSFFGIIDLLTIISGYLSLFFPQVRFLVVIRIFRLLRVFGILNMGQYIDESSYLIRALKASIPKVSVFLFTMVFIILLVGTLMYIIEGPASGFVNIPESMYWATVTVSTVGYGDISPKTPIGKMLASVLMMVGYGIIAVPTGIISHELGHISGKKEKIKTCKICDKVSYTNSDRFCSNCGNSFKHF